MIFITVGKPERSRGAAYGYKITENSGKAVRIHQNLAFQAEVVHCSIAAGCATLTYGYENLAFQAISYIELTLIKFKQPKEKIFNLRILTI